MEPYPKLYKYLLELKSGIEKADPGQMRAKNPTPKLINRSPPKN
jgi:hypothetical protein